jgi:GYF domain 2
MPRKRCSLTHVLLSRYDHYERQIVDYVREATRKNIWYYRDRMSVPRGPCPLPVKHCSAVIRSPNAGAGFLPETTRTKQHFKSHLYVQCDCRCTPCRVYQGHHHNMLHQQVLRECWVHGIIDENTLVWGQGLVDWLPIRNVRTLVAQIRTPEGACRTDHHRAVYTA